jgi:hypothetical protein
MRQVGYGISHRRMSWVLWDAERGWKNAKRQPCQLKGEAAQRNQWAIRNDAAAAVIDVKLACSLRGL